MEEGIAPYVLKEIFLCCIKDLYLYNERDRDMYTQLFKLTKILNCENTFRMFLATFARKAIEIYVLLNYVHYFLTHFTLIYKIISLIRNEYYNTHVCTYTYAIYVYI